MINYYIREINSKSSAVSEILYGAFNKPGWDQRHNFVVRYLKKYYIHKALQVQMAYMNHSISEEELVKNYKYYFAILSVIEKEGYVNYFKIKGRQALNKEERVITQDLLNGKITEEAYRNKLRTYNMKSKDFERIEKEDDLALKYAIVSGEDILARAILKGVKLDKVDSYINEASYLSLLKDMKLSIEEYSAKIK